MPDKCIRDRRSILRGICAHPGVTRRAVAHPGVTHPDGAGGEREAAA